MILFKKGDGEKHPNRLKHNWALDIGHEGLRRSGRKGWCLRSSFPEGDSDVRICE